MEGSENRNKQKGFIQQEIGSIRFFFLLILASKNYRKKKCFSSITGAPENGHYNLITFTAGQVGFFFLFHVWNYSRELLFKLRCQDRHHLGQLCQKCHQHLNVLAQFFFNKLLRRANLSNVHTSWHVTVIV